MKRFNKYIFVLAFCILSTYTVNLFAQVDLLSNYSWDKFSGAKAVNASKSIDIEPIDRKIRTKTGSNFFPNPPINLCGPKLELSGDFEVYVTVDITSNPSKYAYLDFYGSIPKIFDEWRVEGYVLRVGIKDGTLNTWVNWNQESFTKSGLTGVVEISIARVGTEITISANGNSVGSFTESGNKEVFKTGEMYFGAEAELDGGFRINDITANGSITSVDNYDTYIKTYPTKTESLRNYASQLSQPFHIGATVIANALLSDTTYGRIMAEEFTIVTPEVDMKMQAIHPIEGQYAWSEMDAIVDFTEKNSMAVHGHCLVWHEALPQWVWDIYDSNDKAKMRQVMQDHIKAVVTRYKGKINKYDLLNEIIGMYNSTPTTDNPYALRNAAEPDNNPSVWYWAYDDNSNNTKGHDFVIDAIKAARSIDPNVELWINEFGTDQFQSNHRIENILKLIDYIVSKGEKIDGVGYQSHNYDPDNDPSIASELLVQMQKVSAKGVKVRVSELDVSGIEYWVPTNNVGLFSDKLDVCVDFDNNPACDGLTMWGFTEKYGSMCGDDDGGNFPIWNYHTWNSLIFDEDYNKRVSHQRMINVLKIAGGDGNTQSPYSGTPFSIPGKIELEDYDFGGQGISYNDLDDGNKEGKYRIDDVDIESCSEGGYNLAYTDDGEWLEYTVDVKSNGSYTINLRGSTDYSSCKYKLYIDGNAITSTINIPSTNGWQSWKDVSTSGISLTEGEHVLKFEIISGGFNANYIEFIEDTATDINEVFSNSIDMELNQNLVEDYFILNLGSIIGEYQFIITCIDGKVILKSKLVGSETKISTNSLQSGIYLVVVTDGVKLATKKLVVK